MSAALWKRLKRASQSTGMGMAQLVREAVTRLLDDYERRGSLEIGQESLTTTTTK